ncbi:hypothetical protein [Streptomyces sp. KL116D]|uniref:LexA family protein n=1 Tax=Streptomyces sp. KL116D TaxID=3045152 RepID=UPI0035591572
MPDLTERQHAIPRLRTGVDHEHREPPTLTRIGTAVGLRSRSAVHYQLRQLETLALVRIVNGRPSRSGGTPSPLCAASAGRRSRPAGAVRTETGVVPVRRDLGRPSAPRG